MHDILMPSCHHDQAMSRQEKAPKKAWQLPINLLPCFYYIRPSHPDRSSRVCTVQVVGSRDVDWGVRLNHDDPHGGMIMADPLVQNEDPNVQVLGYQHGDPGFRPVQNENEEQGPVQIEENEEQGPVQNDHEEQGPVQNEEQGPAQNEEPHHVMAEGAAGLEMQEAGQLEEPFRDMEEGAAGLEMQEAGQNEEPDRDIEEGAAGFEMQEAGQNEEPPHVMEEGDAGLEMQEPGQNEEPPAVMGEGAAGLETEEPMPNEIRGAICTGAPTAYRAARDSKTHEGKCPPIITLVIKMSHNQGLASLCLSSICHS